MPPILELTLYFRRDFPSKEWIIERLISEGVDKPIALWLATNLVVIPGEENERGDVSPSRVGWGFNLDTIIGTNRSCIFNRYGVFSND